MPLSHAKLWKAVDGLARREGLTPSGLARRAGLDATSFNPSKRFGTGDPPRPRWPSTESVTLILQATGVSLALRAGGETVGTVEHRGPRAVDETPFCGFGLYVALT